MTAVHLRPATGFVLPIIILLAPPILTFGQSSLPRSGFVPAAIDSLTREPVSISPQGKGLRSASFRVPNDQAALIQTPDFVCLIELHDTAVSGRKRYSFRTFHLASGHEIRGEGEVFENYYRISQPNESAPNSATVVDKGSVLFIDAGFVKILWSSSRWLYYDSSIARISAGSESDYERRIREAKRP